MNVIEARGLTKVYGGRAVVSDFAMTVAAGDIYGFVGKNGAGKSTVMKMICGDVLPTAGEVVLFEGDRVSAGAAGAARAAGSAGDGEGVRRIGAASVDLAYVASGRQDAFYEMLLKPWDVAAGWLLVEEAGGRVTTLEGNPYVFGEEIMASNGLVHEELRKLLAPVTPVRAERKPA